MKLKFLKFAFLGLILSVSSFANAGLITNIELIDSNNFEVSISGILDGPTPSGSGYLFILLNPLSDPITCGSIICTANYVSGDLQESGGNAPGYQWVADYLGGPHIQFYWGGFLDAGDSISGSNIFSVATGHGMSSSDFNDAKVYWGFSSEISDGVFQGGVNNTSVPEPSTLAIFALGIFGLVARRFKK